MAGVTIRMIDDVVDLYDKPDGWGEDEQLLEKCARCNGAGEIACSIYFPCSYIGPGPVPDYARGVRGCRCDVCGGTGWVEEGAQ